MGIGTNRFNAHTLATSVQGHINYLRETYPSDDLSVVIVYDVRCFHDMRGVYNPQVDNPLTAITSRHFARIAAEVYCANGVHVHVPDEHSADYVSTPELSFAIRRLATTAGLNISASHNHPDDNGGKFYDRHGSQEIPPDDEKMAKHVENVTTLPRLDFKQAAAAGLISRLPEDIHAAYIAENIGQSLQGDARQARIVFSPLHGAGLTSVGSTLRQAGFNVEIVAEQSTYDGAFPAVPFRSPNPEVPESMAQGVELARRSGAELVMACDPDADRIGLYAKTTAGDYRFFNGNQIAVLVTHYKLEQLADLGQSPAHPLVIKTEVTTGLLQVITEHFGGTLIGDLLVGFKYHGNILKEIESQRQYRGIDVTLKDFIVAVEESHGVLVSSKIRDKDAAGAAILLAELASVLLQRGITMIDYLDDIYRRFGYYANHLTSMVMRGAEGLRNIRKIQQALRASPPREIAGQPVIKVVDHWDETGNYGPIVSETDRTARNVLVFTLERGARIIIRPSGTEPKNKIYIEVPTSPLGAQATPKLLAAQKSAADAMAREIGDDFTRQMLSIIDVVLPRYALRISGLVALDKRIDFVENFIPGLETRVLESIVENTPALDKLSDWIDQHLAPYGHDSRGLVCDAVAEYVSSQRQDCMGDPMRQRVLDTIEEVFAS